LEPIVDSISHRLAGRFRPVVNFLDQARTILQSTGVGMNDGVALEALDRTYKFAV
jgi:hypothetical protein